MSYYKVYENPEIEPEPAAIIGEKFAYIYDNDLGSGRVVFEVEEARVLNDGIHVKGRIIDGEADRTKGDPYNVMVYEYPENTWTKKHITAKRGG